MQALLQQFISSFQKAISVEMEAMRQRLGPFEVPLVDGKILQSSETEKWNFYELTIVQPNDKLALQAECTLTCEKGEILVTITELRQNTVTLRSERKIDVKHPPYTLVIYPWFLYERLKQSLESLLKSQNVSVSNALMVFGKHPPQKQPQSFVKQHHGLNDSQQQALQLCSDSNLAFVWGPPGTGKTTTLGHIVTELLHQGQRILLTSTTNAAVDQALASLAALADAQEFFEKGHIVRIGQTSAETFGATLPQVVQQLHAKTQEHLKHLQRRIREVSRQIDRCSRFVEKLKSANQHRQDDLFRTVMVETIALRDFSTVFSEKFARKIVRQPSEQQQEVLSHRRTRLQRLLELCQAKMKQYHEELRNQESTIVQNARVLLATMTNVYMSSLLQDERFDTVIVEEAGMAILPTLFYCAALAKTKVIIVGDPQQLPPIVQSKDEYVYRAMGRNIFAVAASNSNTEENTALLNTQYRMHPTIGNLVNDLFYDGKLRHGANTNERKAIAAKKPYPDAPLIVIDTDGQTTCFVREGSYSRLNEDTAQLCVELALEAVQAGVESVAIITPYVAQSRLIRQLLSKHRNEAQQVDCQTVHRFQGGERDMVILDTVDTSPLSPGVLLAGHSERSSAQNLINVSISRARGKLIIISDVAYFKKNSPKSIINEVLRQAALSGIRVSLPI